MGYGMARLILLKYKDFLVKLTSRIKSGQTTTNFLVTGTGFSVTRYKIELEEVENKLSVWKQQQPSSSNLKISNKMAKRAVCVLKGDVTGTIFFDQEVSEEIGVIARVIIA